MKSKNKVPFNPSAFDSIVTIEEISQDFPNLHEIVFSKVSLANELVSLNYEIVSSDYKDFEFSNFKDYYHFEVDKIV